MRGLGLVILRLSVGVVFIAHGLPKLVPVWGRSPAEAAAILDMAGVASGPWVAAGTGLTELLAGALVVAGAYTVWASFLLALTTAAGVWLLNVSNGFFLNWSLEPGIGHGYEFGFLQLSALACLALAGPGAWSYDARRTRERERRKGRRSGSRGQKKR